MTDESISWVAEDRPLNCRVCGVVGVAKLIAVVSALDEDHLEAIRCENCGSIQLVEHPRDFSPTDASIDSYVESGAGIGTMAEVFAEVEHRQGMRFLDVGCNYPFALDLARFLYGWEVLGIEPSPAAERGGRELQVDVRTAYLTAESQIGTDFDVVLASEVIEHVTDPLAFLIAIRERLSATGTLVMTTPAAEIVTKEAAQTEVLLAISPGYHVFLASVAGMELLLTKAGFSSFRVKRDRGSLRVTASISTLAPVSARPVELADLDRYYEWRGTRTAIRSPLAVGLASRLYRLRVARGEFEAATSVLPRLIRSTRAVHRLNLSRPRGALLRRRLRRSAPLSIIGSTFAMGMYELLYRERPRRAAEYFELSELACESVLARSDIIDGDASDLRFQAPFHHALALARFNPAAAARLALDLPTRLDASLPRGAELVASRQCRVYTELVAAGAYDADATLTELVARTAPPLARDRDADVRTAALDGLFSLGMSALQRRDTSAAVDWWTVCLETALSAPQSRETTAMVIQTRQHLAIAHEHREVQRRATKQVVDDSQG